MWKVTRRQMQFFVTEVIFLTFDSEFVEQCVRFVLDFFVALQVTVLISIVNTAATIEVVNLRASVIEQKISFQLGLTGVRILRLTHDELWAGHDSYTFKVQFLGHFEIRNRRQVDELCNEFTRMCSGNPEVA